MRNRTIVLIVLLGVICISLFASSSYASELLPDKCTFPTGIYCEDWWVEVNRTRLLIQNGLGKDLILKKLVVTEISSSPLHRCEMTSGEITIPNRESATIMADRCSVTSVIAGRKYKYDIDVTYQFVGSEEEHMLQGELFAGVDGARDYPGPSLGLLDIPFFSDFGRIPIYFLLYVGVIVFLLKKTPKEDLKKYEDFVSLHPDKGFMWPTRPKLYLFFLTMGIWIFDNFLNLTMVGDVIMPVPQADFILLNPLISFLAMTKLSFLVRSGRGLLPLVPLQLLYWYLTICFSIFAWKAVSMRRFRLLIRSKLSLSIIVIILISLVSAGGNALYLSLALDSSTKEAVRNCQKNFSGFYEDDCIGEVIGVVAESDPDLALKMTRYYDVYWGPTLVKVVGIYAQEDIDRAYWLCRQHAVQFLDLWKCLTHVVTSGKQEDIPRIIEICEEYDELVPWSYRKGECMETAYAHYQEKNNITNLKEFCMAAETTFEKGLCSQKDVAGSLGQSGDIIQLSVENITAALSLCENTRPQFSPCWNLLQYPPEELDEEKLYEIYQSLGEWEALVFIEKKAKILDSDHPERWDICINAQTQPQLYACSYPQIHWFLIRDDIVIERFERDPISTQKLCQNSRQKPPCGAWCPQWKELYSYPLCDYLVNLTQSELEETHSLYVKTGEFPIEISDGLYGDTKRANNPKSEKDCEIDNNPELVGTCFMNLALSTGVLKYCRKAIYNASACAIELDADKTTPIEDLDILCHDLADLETGRWLEVSWSCYKDIAIHRQEVSLCQKAERYAGECAIGVDTDKSLPLEELEAVCEAVSWTPEFKRKCYEDIAVHRQ